jgi:hypothetical protein
MCLILVKEVLPRIQTLYHAGCISAEEKDNLVNLIRKTRIAEEINEFAIYLENLRLDIPDDYQDTVDEIYKFCKQC